MTAYTVTYCDAGRGERQAESFATLAEAEAYATETRDMFERTGHAWLAPGVSIIEPSAGDAGDTGEEYPYSVYTLTDGALGVDDAYATEAEAYAAYEALIEAELTYRADECVAKGIDYTETTVHLYYAPWGNMLAELCIESA